MFGYLAKRLAMTIPTLLLVAIAVFTLVRLIPGDPVQVMLGDSADPAQIEALRQQLGLDRPIPIQFALWLGKVVTGDLGHSITNGLAVLPLILDRFQVSAIIVLTAVLIATCIAVPAGLIAAWRQNSAVDLAVVGSATLLLSIPSFWLGLLLLLLFGLKLKWLPVIGYVPFSENFGQALMFIILPIVTLALVEIGVLARMARATSIEVLRLEYVTHARAKGVPEWRVLGRHVLPNAFAPTWTLIGLVLGHLLGGIAVIETVFTLPGLGRLLVDSIFARDYPVVQGCLLFTAVVYVAVNLVVDLCYPLFDPRVAAEWQIRANNAIGGVLIGVLVCTAITACFWTPFDPLRINLRARLQPPSALHWLGTDEFGRDALSRIMAGALTSLMVALMTVVCAVVIGALIGVVTGYLRGWTDRAIMAVNDALLSFPGVLLALAMMMIVGANKFGIVLALSLAYTPSVVRVVRGTVLSIREKEYIEASRVIGNSELYSMMRHVLPNSLAPVAVLATSMFGWVLLAESALSFLGLGVPPPAPTWGNMLAASRPYMETATWLSIAPGVCIALTLLGINLLGDALRDHLDPRTAIE